MTKTLPDPRIYHRADVHLELRADGNLPPGIAGRLSGVALTYDVVDTYDTMFARGCAKRSVDTKVAARKLPLLMDHERSVKAHVGVVATMTDVGDALVLTADLLDTPEGRAAREYAQAVIAAGASTGFSIGFVPRRSERVMVDGKAVERFTEIELREVSMTPMPAVPGTDLTSARTDAADAPVVVEQSPAFERTDTDLLVVAARLALDALPAAERAVVLDAYRPALSDATPTVTSGRSATVTVQAPADSPYADAHALSHPTVTVASSVASMADRLSAVRTTYQV